MGACCGKETADESAPLSVGGPGAEYGAVPQAEPVNLSPEPYRPPNLQSVKPTLPAPLDPTLTPTRAPKVTTPKAAATPKATTPTAVATASSSVSSLLAGSPKALTAGAALSPLAVAAVANESEPDDGLATALANLMDKRCIQFLTDVGPKGATFIKHGRSGDPHQRRVHLTADGLVNFTSGSVALADVILIASGKITDVFRKESTKADPACCFSLITSDRTLDLQATSVESAAVWCEGLSWVHKRLLEHLKTSGGATSPSAAMASLIASVSSVVPAPTSSSMLESFDGIDAFVETVFMDARASTLSLYAPGHRVDMQRRLADLVQRLALRPPGSTASSIFATMHVLPTGML